MLVGFDEWYLRELTLVFIPCLNSELDLLFKSKKSRLILSILTIFAIALMFFKLLTYNNPANEFIKIKGTALTYKAEQHKVFKGGFVTHANIRYRYEYQNIVYESERITCDANGRLIAHSAKSDELALLLNFVDEVEKTKVVTV